MQAAHILQVQILETSIGNEYLNSALLPSLPSSSEIQISLDNTSKRDSLPPLPTHNSQPELSAATMSRALKRNSSAGAGFRQQSLILPPPKKRTAFGAASGHGRLFKVLGDLFLLAGKTEDALIWWANLCISGGAPSGSCSFKRYIEAVASLKTPQDAIWHASALEGMATVSLLDAWSSGHGIVRQLLCDSA
jgi:hypothetical protein